MRPSAENLKVRERFLTPRYYSMLTGSSASELDPFTMTQEYPRTFKIGACHAASPTDLHFQVQLYWRDDEKTQQQEVQANLVKQDNAWLLDGVGSKSR
jgi:predicted DNA-binding transcriptional regulator AlpA